MPNPPRSHKLHLAIEGIDGTGKSTALTNTRQLLEEAGVTVSVVHYTQKAGLVGRLISRLYKPDFENKIVQGIRDYRPLQATLYAINGRMNLLKRDRGSDVLLADRSILSGYASHIGRVPSWLISAAESTNSPDVIAFLELPIDEASKRIDIREQGEVGYEEDLQTLQEFSDDYELVLQNLPKRLQHTTIERIDANQDPFTLARSIARIALEHL